VGHIRTNEFKKAEALIVSSAQLSTTSQRMWESESKSPLIPDFGTRWRWQLCSSGKELRVPTGQKAELDPEPFWMWWWREKFFM